MFAGNQAALAVECEAIGTDLYALGKLAVENRLAKNGKRAPWSHFMIALAGMSLSSR